MRQQFSSQARILVVDCERLYAFRHGDTLPNCGEGAVATAYVYTVT